MEEPNLDTILRSKGLKKDNLDHKCTDEHLNKLALEIDSWKSFAPYIGLTRQDEEDIEDEYRKNLDKKVAMLRRWSEKYSDEATYLKLAESFDSLKRRDLIVVLIDLSQSRGTQASQSGATSGKQEVPRGKKKYPIPKLSDKPKPGQLIKLVGKSGKEVYIRDALAGDWEDLLMMLDLEPAESLIRRIRKDTGYQGEEACREVLLKWLTGQGKKPITWETLIGVIKDMGQGELASEIKSEILPG